MYGKSPSLMLCSLLHASNAYHKQANQAQPTTLESVLSFKILKTCKLWNQTNMVPKMGSHQESSESWKPYRIFRMSGQKISCFYGGCTCDSGSARPMSSCAGSLSRGRPGRRWRRRGPTTTGGGCGSRCRSSPSPGKEGMLSRFYAVR